MSIQQGLRVAAVTGSNMGYFLSELAYIIYAVSPKDGPLPYPGMPVIFFLIINFFVVQSVRKMFNRSEANESFYIFLFHRFLVRE